jgi:hypothetical protein
MILVKKGCNYEYLRNEWRIIAVYGKNILCVEQPRITRPGSQASCIGLSCKELHAAPCWGEDRIAALAALFTFYQPVALCLQRRRMHFKAIPGRF